MDMALISLRDVGVVTPRPLFQNVTFSFGPGDRVGLIAGNGGGKSTLLRCVAGQADPDAGSIVLSRGLRVGHVEQDVPDTVLSLTLHEAVRRALPPGAAHPGQQGHYGQPGMPGLPGQPGRSPVRDGPGDSEGTGQYL